MSNWEEKRAGEIKEYILVTHIICILIFAMVVFSFYNYKLGANISGLLRGNIAVFAVYIIAIIYIARKIILKIALLDQPRTDEVLLVAVIFPLTFVFLYFSRDFYGAKVLIMVPVTIVATAFGRNWGAGAAVSAGALLFLLDYKIFAGIPPDVFQTNVIVGSVTTLLAWLVGGLMEVEKKTQEELVKMADYDQLTGLYNHRRLQEELALSLQKASSAGTNVPFFPASGGNAAQGGLSLVLLDIDQFKYYNAVYGYQKGDDVLAAVGRILLAEVRKPFYAARYGGDEFALVLPGMGKDGALKEADGIKEKIIAVAASCLFANGGPPAFKPFTISVGLAVYPADGEAALQLIRSAEDDLFRVKYSKDKTYIYKSVLSEISTLKIQDAYPALQSFVALINARDRYTFGHSERVMSYAMALGEKIRLSAEEKDILRYGAYLHDIGKIEIESTILNKINPLNEKEWEVMQSHTVTGYEIVQMVKHLKEIGPLIRSHHENYDGSGYPDGLKGEETPLLARILRLADSFDAMTTSRPYRKALKFSEACLELKKYAGIHYDPWLVKLFLSVVKEVYKKRIS